MTSLEVGISTGGVDLQLGDPLPPTTVDSDMGLPPMVTTPTDKIIDGGLVENQSGKSVGELYISNDLRFDVASFANSVAADDLSEDIDDEANDEESSYPKPRPRSINAIPTLYTCYPQFQTKRVKSELALVSLFEVLDLDIGDAFVVGKLATMGYIGASIQLSLALFPVLYSPMSSKMSIFGRMLSSFEPR